MPQPKDPKGPKKGPRSQPLAALLEGESAMGDRLVSDGAWTWYNDPRAIEYNGALYVTFIRTNGDVVVTKVVLSTGVRTLFVLSAAFHVDDHANPALAFLPDGRLLATYSKHNDTTGLRVRISSSAEDVTAWGSESTVPKAGATDTAYANPWVLSDEGDRLYLMFRGVSDRPILIYSDDWDTAGTPTWSTPRPVFADDLSERPYLKYVSDGEGRLHFFASGAHPAEATAGSCHLYHWYYDAADGNFHTSDGTAIRSLASLATTGILTPSEVTKVYDATSHNGGGNGNAWPWSIELDPSGDPVVTFSAFEAIDDNDYFYAYWDGSAWVRRRILTGQGSLYGAGDTAEDQYVGGLVVDPADTARLIVSNDTSGQWELEEWTTVDNGANWSTSAITSGSSVKNFRPVFVRNGSGRFLWCRGTYTSFVSYATEIYAEPAVKAQTFRDAIAAMSPAEHLSHDDTSGTVADALVGTDGTYVNAPTLGEPGLIAEGTAVTYNGTDERCDLPDVGAAEGSFTYICFFKSTQTGNDRWLIAEGSTTDNDPFGGLILQSGQLRAALRGDSGTASSVGGATGVLSGGTWNDGNRHQAAVTWDGTTLRIYGDGLLRNSATGTPGTRTLNTSAVAALRRAAVGQWFAGTIDEPAIFTRALSAAEINTLYEARDAEPALPTGDIAQTLPAITQSAAGAVTAPSFTGTAAQTLPAISQAAAGTFGTPGFAGTVAQTLPSLTQAASGAHTAPTFAGAVAQSLPSLTQAAAGAVTAPSFTGTATQSLPAVTQAATGTHTAPSFTGTSAQTLPSLTQAAAGTAAPPEGAGIITQTLPSLTQAAMGTFSTPVFTGAANQSLPALTQTATGATQPPTFTADAAQVLPAMAQAAIGATSLPTRVGVVAQTLPALTQTATGGFGVPVFTAVIAQVLPMLTQSLTDRKPVATTTLGVREAPSMVLGSRSSRSLSLSTRPTPTLEVT